MTWLRVDDRFTEHEKVLRLPRADRWTWMEVLCYCARQSREGVIPAQITTIYRHATYKFLKRCIDAGLVDVESATGELRIHDFSVYNPKDPTGAERQSRFRNARRNASSNGENNASRVGAQPCPDPTPYSNRGGEGRDRSEESEVAAPAVPNGAAPLNDKIVAMAAYVQTFWDEYPDLSVLQDELTDRGLPVDQAAGLIAAESERRS